MLAEAQMVGRIEDLVDVGIIQQLAAWTSYDCPQHLQHPSHLVLQAEGKDSHTLRIEHCSIAGLACKCRGCRRAKNNRAQPLHSSLVIMSHPPQFATGHLPSNAIRSRRCSKLPPQAAALHTLIVNE